MMNHEHTCPCCDDVALCDWGYEDDECGIYDEPIVECQGCIDAKRREGGWNG